MGSFSLIPVLSFLIVSVLVGFLIQRKEVWAPLEVLRSDVQAVASGKARHLNESRHLDRFGAIARTINSILDRRLSTAMHSVATTTEPGLSALSDLSSRPGTPETASGAKPVQPSHPVGGVPRGADLKMSQIHPAVTGEASQDIPALPNMPNPASPPLREGRRNLLSFRSRAARLNHLRNLISQGCPPHPRPCRPSRSRRLDRLWAHLVYSLSWSVTVRHRPFSAPPTPPSAAPVLPAAAPALPQSDSPEIYPGMSSNVLLGALQGPLQGALLAPMMGYHQAPLPPLPPRDRICPHRMWVPLHRPG